MTSSKGNPKTNLKDSKRENKGSLRASHRSLASTVAEMSKGYLGSQTKTTSNNPQGIKKGKLLAKKQKHKRGQKPHKNKKGPKPHNANNY